MDDIQEQNEIAEEISGALSQPIGFAQELDEVSEIFNPRCMRKGYSSRSVCECVCVSERVWVIGFAQELDEVSEIFFVVLVQVVLPTAGYLVKLMLQCFLTLTSFLRVVSMNFSFPIVQ